MNFTRETVEGWMDGKVLESAPMMRSVCDDWLEQDAEIKRLRLFRKYLEELLACYRTGKRPTDQCLDGLAKLRAAEAVQQRAVLPGKDGGS